MISLPESAGIWLALGTVLGAGLLSGLSPCSLDIPLAVAERALILAKKGRYVHIIEPCSSNPSEQGYD